ncbi:MAG: hypothetical protein HGA45_37720 [Chloroflexales bacterium]|nr:hypothetical protein [Chloroflexales bacterium]
MTTPSAQTERRERFVARYLDPVDRLAEVVYGVLIVLTFTLAYRGIEAHDAAMAAFTATAVRRMLLAALGCTVAWGLIDAVMYVLTSLFERSQQQRMLVDIQRAPDRPTALALIGTALEERLGAALTAEERAALSASIYGRFRDHRPEHVGVIGEDFLGAVAIFLLAVTSTLPVLIPYLFIDDPFLAIRTSNLIAVAMLFGVGYAWARHTNANPLRVGLGLAGLGVAMVLIAIPLGG